MTLICFPRPTFGSALQREMILAGRETSARSSGADAFRDGRSVCCTGGGAGVAGVLPVTPGFCAHCSGTFETVRRRVALCCVGAEFSAPCWRCSVLKSPGGNVHSRIKLILSLNQHSKQLTKKCFFHLRDIAKLRALVSEVELEMIIHAFISWSLRLTSLRLNRALKY